MALVCALDARCRQNPHNGRFPNQRPVQIHHRRHRLATRLAAPHLDQQRLHFVLEQLKTTKQIFQRVQ